MDIDVNASMLLNHLTKSIEPNWKIFEVFNIDEGLEQYKKNKIDFVIIDFCEENNKKLLEEILKINSHQKTITLGEELKCSELQGCEFCIIHHNRKRLLKPFHPHDLYKTIKEFDSKECQYIEFTSPKNIERFLPKIIERFLYFTYNQTTKTITVINKYDKNKYVLEFLDIISLLNQHNIKYNTISDTELELV